MPQSKRAAHSEPKSIQVFVDKKEVACVVFPEDATALRLNLHLFDLIPANSVSIPTALHYLLLKEQTWLSLDDLARKLRTKGWQVGGVAKSLAKAKNVIRESLRRNPELFAHRGFDTYGLQGWA